MSTVTARFEPGRQWIWLPERIPAASTSPRSCEGKYVSGWEEERRTTVAAAGTLCVEAMKNDKGVVASVILPNGVACPTGKQAPNDCWFPMLKTHLRRWLALSSPGRIYKISTDGIAELERDLQSLHPSDRGHVLGRRMLDLLRSYQAEAADSLPAMAKENDIMVSFYDWLVMTSESVALPQKDVLEAVERGLKTGKKVEVPDLDASIFKLGVADRYLDL